MSARRTRSSSIDIPLGSGEDDDPPEDDRFYDDNFVFEEDDEEEEDLDPQYVDIESHNLDEDFSSAVHGNRRAANLILRDQLISSTYFSDVVPDSYIELTTRISLPSNLRQTTRDLWQGLGKATRKLFGLLNPAQPVLVFPVADFTALGHAVEDIPNLPLQEILQLTPLVKCTSKQWGSRSVLKVIGGKNNTIIACQRGRPILYRSKVFLLVAFDPDAEGGKEWHEITEDDNRLQHFLDLAEYKQVGGTACYLCAFGTSNVLAVCKSLTALDKIIPAKKHFRKDDLDSAGDGGVPRGRTGPGDEDFAYTLYPLLGDRNAFAAKEQQIIPEATARITTLNTAVYAYSNSQVGTPRELKVIITTDTPSKRPLAGAISNRQAGRYTGCCHKSIGKVLKGDDVKNIDYHFRGAQEGDTMGLGPTALGKQRLPFDKDGNKNTNRKEP